MAKENNFLDIYEKRDRKSTFAIILAIFGILLFIAFALTSPWGA